MYLIREIHLRRTINTKNQTEIVCDIDTKMEKNFKLIKKELG